MYKFKEYENPKNFLNFCLDNEELRNKKELEQLDGLLKFFENLDLKKSCCAVQDKVWEVIEDTRDKIYNEKRRHNLYMKIYKMLLDFLDLDLESIKTEISRYTGGRLNKMINTLYAYDPESPKSDKFLKYFKDNNSLTEEEKIDLILDFYKNNR